MDTNNVLEVYNNLMTHGRDYWWSATRALTIKHAASIEWRSPVLELGGQNGIVSEIIGRPIQLMVDTDPDVTKDSEGYKIYKMVMKGSAEDLSDVTGQFKTVVGLNMIYHCNRVKVLNEVYKILEPGGIAIFTDTPGYNGILTYSFLARCHGSQYHSDIYRTMECDGHMVNIVPTGWWDHFVDKGKWEIIEKRPYASVDMCLIARAHYTLRAASSRGVIDNNLFDEVLDLAHRRNEIPEMLEKDNELCEKAGAVFLMVVLRKK